MTIGVQQLMKEVERARDAFDAAVLGTGDLEAALAAAAPDCALVHLPMGTGAVGVEELRRFLAEDLLPHLPADLHVARTSRTVDRWRVADEGTVSFTHDRELPWLLPEVAPTHRPVQVLTMSVVAVHQGRVTSHRTLWDLAGLVGQLRLELGPTGAVRHVG